MVKLSEISNIIENYAPSSLKMDFDNVGLLIGDRDRNINRVLIALEITEQVIDEAVEINAELIVTHHPVLFSLKSITPETPQGKRVMKLLEHKISAICMHTNLDIVSGGVNDALAAIAGLSVIGPLADGGIDQSGKIYGIGRTGKLGRKMPMSEFLAFLKNALHTNGLRYYDSGRPVYHVAVGGGSCGEYLEEAVKLGCDTFLTADIKYDSFLDARYYQLNLIDGDHFCTENVVTPVLLRWLSKAFPDLNVQISKSHGQTVQFF